MYPNVKILNMRASDTRFESRRMKADRLHGSELLFPLQLPVQASLALTPDILTCGDTYYVSHLSSFY